jgi:hypothetical protein
MTEQELSSIKTMAAFELNGSTGAQSYAPIRLKQNCAKSARAGNLMDFEAARQVPARQR